MKSPSIRTVDARGQACPRPVMMAKEALDGGAHGLEIIVDNAISAANVRRFLAKRGWTTAERGQAPEIVVTAQGEEGVDDRALPEEGTPPEGTDDQSFLIARATLGGDDSALGEVLMKAFLGTMAQQERPPRTIALMNEGVRLALRTNSAWESLQILQDRGTTVLVCGTCVSHFGVAQALAVGTLSNMFEITEAVTAASRQLCLG